MNWDRIKGNWKQIKGRIKQRWGKLTDDEIAQAEGRREEFLGFLQKRYGLAKDKAEKELAELLEAEELSSK